MKEHFLLSLDCYKQFFMRATFIYNNIILSSITFVAVILIALLTNSRAEAESYTLPGESSEPSAEEFIGSPGLVGIYYGHLPRDGHPR